MGTKEKTIAKTNFIAGRTTPDRLKVKPGSRRSPGTTHFHRRTTRFACVVASEVLTTIVYLPSARSASEIGKEFIPGVTSTSHGARTSAPRASYHATRASPDEETTKCSSAN